jgi:hypothetical protein
MLLADELLARATLQAREDEARHLFLVSEARRLAEQDRERPVWGWRVARGMEGTFQHLLGWLLSSRRDAEIEVAASSQRSASPPDYCPPACCRWAA